MQYPGGKNQYGFYQKIINLIPKHDTYIETHLGSGAIMRHKKTANNNIGIEINQSVINTLSNNLPKGCDIVCSDAIEFIKQYNFNGNEFIYCDPPYLRNTRKSTRCLYQYEYTEDDHKSLLNILLKLPCNIMISGYQSKLYNNYLQNWHSVEFQVKIRSGKIATEVVWMNYEKPVELHDYRYIGNDYRDRERIKRKTQRWVNNFNLMPKLEKAAILSSITASSLE